MFRYLILLLTVVPLTTGCAFIKPTTKVTMNPLTRTVGIYNTKDVDLSFDKLAVTWGEKGGGNLAVDNFVVADKATPVIEANVQQMMAFVEQQKAANEGIIGSLQAIASMVNTLARAFETILPGSSISLDTPIGAGSATLGVGVDGPTTQPAKRE